MEIRNSNFNQPTYKNIKPYECSMVAVEGPNTMGKMSLQGLEIAYDSFFVSKMVLNSGATNKPIVFGFLGADITYLMIKVNYSNGAGIRCATLEKKEFYIEYYFSDNPSFARPIGQLMVLTGGSNHRIPQIFLNNPMDFPVTVEIMAASVEPAATTENGVSTGAVIDGLFYNSIITDNFAGGSTQFEIINERNEVQLILPIQYFLQDENIQNIKQDGSTLTITTENTDKVILKFLTVYDANQAHSRMNWIFENPTHRYLTVDLPEPDLAAPVITMNAYAGDTFNLSGITKDELRTYYVVSVVDSRDGVIDVNDVEVILRKHDTLVTIPAIVEEGVYDVIFRVKDIASNEATVMRVATFDMTPPAIVFKPAVVGNTVSLSISNDSQLIPTAGLTEMDIVRFCVDRVTDAIDGDIPKSAVTLAISGATFPITVGGSIPVIFSVSDSSGNVATVSGKTLVIVDDITPMLTDGLIFATPTTTISGGFASGYSLLLDGNSGTTYTLQYLSGVTKDKDLASSLFPFSIVAYDLSGNTLEDYYNLAYSSGATLDYLLGVASGINPLFYIGKSGVTGEFMFDGLNYNISNTQIGLQLRGDFPVGTYHVSGEVTDISGNTASIQFTIVITQ